MIYFKNVKVNIFSKQMILNEIIMYKLMYFFKIE